VVTGFATRV